MVTIVLIHNAISVAWIIVRGLDIVTIVTFSVSVTVSVSVTAVTVSVSVTVTVS